MGPHPFTKILLSSIAGLESVGNRLLNTLLNLFPHESGFLGARLKEDANPVGVVVHGEVGQPCAGVGVHNDLVAAVDVDDDVLSGHAVLVVVLMVLIEDRGNFLAVLSDGQKRLLVVVGGNVEHEHVAAASRSGEDTGVGVKSTADVAVGAVEGQVFLATAVVRLGSVGVEEHAQRLVGQAAQEGVLFHHSCAQLLQFSGLVFVLRVHSGHEVGVGSFPVGDFFADSVVERLVLAVAGVLFGVETLVEGSDVGLAPVVLALGKVVQVGNLCLAGVILAVGKVVEIGNLGFAGIVLSFGEAVQSLDFRLSGAVLTVQFAVKLCNVGDPGLVVLLSPLLKRFDLVLSEIVFSLH